MILVILHLIMPVALSEYFGYFHVTREKVEVLIVVESALDRIGDFSLVAGVGRSTEQPKSEKASDRINVRSKGLQYADSEEAEYGPLLKVMVARIEHIEYDH